MSKRRIVFAIVLLLAIVAACAAKPESQQPNDIAQGSEKVGAEAAHPGEALGGPHAGPKFLGIPAWIWKLVNMTAFLVFLGWLIAGPVKRGLAARHENIRKAAQEARDRRAKSDQMAADIQARLSQIEQEIRSIAERALTDGQRQKSELIAAAEAEAKKILQSARVEIDNRLRNARHELTEYAGQLASERAEQILRDKITESDQKKLFDESVREVEEARS